MSVYNIYNTVIPGTLKEGDILYLSTATSKSFSLPPGSYMFQCWGAQGNSYGQRGSSTYTNYPYGGYAAGTIHLTSATTIYTVCGGAGSYSGGTATTGYSISGGYNGGGSGACKYTSEQYKVCGAGGGASDIRIGTNSLYARVIVAGGGGGCKDSGNSEGSTRAGSGGGWTGENGKYATTTAADGRNAGGGGQNKGGDAAPAAYGTYTGEAGKFGQGGGTVNSKIPSSGDYWNHGGGGGWYGGGAAACDGCSGGGSSYIYCEERASTAENLSGWLLDKKYRMVNVATNSGYTSMPAANTNALGNQGTMTGKNGAGYIRIDVLKTADNSKVWYVKKNGKWEMI